MNDDGLPRQRTSRLVASNVHYRLLLVGLVLVVLSHVFDASLLKVDLDEALANVGVLVFMAGGVQWLFDTSMREQLYQEIASLTIKNVRVGTCGITDVIPSSRDVDYSDEIRQSSKLIVGLNYTPRILEDYIDDFRERARNGLTTVMLVLNKNSPAAHFLASVQGEVGHIDPNLRKLENIVSELNAIKPGTVTLKYHGSVLRYSFVSSDACLWIKLYRNSTGRARIPALQLKPETLLHSYFSQDIEALTEQASRHD